jgi:ABC-type multidrug transport system ATPase subunit
MLQFLNPSNKQKLNLCSTTTSAERRLHVEDLIRSFGLVDQANSLIGTPVRRGISGGQKRRISAASSLISGPKILFLDEVTSGLDSVASFEVISYLKAVAKAKNLIVVASIHQPSSATFDLFDKLLLLSAGKTCYFGSIADVPSYFQNLGFPLAIHQNPAEFLLDLTNTDFSRNNEQAHTRLDKIHAGWTELGAAKLSADLGFTHAKSTDPPLSITTTSKANILLTPMILIHRSFIKSYRDLLTYWLRVAMYLGLAIMMGTVWLRLETTQDSIQPFINAIFFGSAFMSFMAVAYIPAFLEDRATFVKERANGLYGAAAFAMSNFIIGLPFLFLISVLFSTVAYWLSNFTPNGAAFMRSVMWLYLDLVAAESLVVLVSSVFPIFVVALAM